MKFNKFLIELIKQPILLLTVLLCLTFSLIAGQYGIDAYAGFRTLTASSKVTTVNGGAAAYTNGPIDKLMWIGDGKLDIFASTNAAVNSLTLQVLQSSDTTNWTQVTNLSLAVAAQVNITNLSVISGGQYFLGNTNFIVTNNVLYPFSINTLTGTAGPAGGASGINAFAQGWATPNTVESPFTNGTITLNPNGWTEVGFHAIDMNRYVEFVLTGGGTGATNITTVGPIITVPVQNIQP